MKKILIQIALLIAIVVVGYFVYDSIMEPVEFNNEKRTRDLVVIQKLKDIRASQMVYKQVNGSYSDNFDTLVKFLKVAELPMVKIIPDPEDTTFTKTINDTIGYINVSDTLFKKRDYKITELSLIPFSDGEHFQMDSDTIERGGVEVHVFEVLAPYSAYLKGMDKQTVRNLSAKQEDIEKYPGLKVGSLVEPTTDGNWE